jgi:hypothetical protein
MSVQGDSAGVAVRYRAVSRADWDAIKTLPVSQWPIIPDALRRARREAFGRMAERVVVWALLVLALVGVASESVRLNDILWRTAGLKKGEAGLSFTGEPLPQRAWVGRMNALYEKLIASDLHLERFGWSSDGLEIDFGQTATPARQRELLDACGFKNLRRKGALWVAQN